MGCCQSKQDVSETKKSRPASNTRAKIYLAPPAIETVKEQGVTDTSPAWLEQLAINLPEVDLEEQRIQRENYQRSPSISKTELVNSTGIFQLADFLKPVSKEDYNREWFYRLLTDHTFKVDYDKRLTQGSPAIDLYINVVGLQGIIPDRAQVAFICHHYHPSVVTIVTGRVRNNRFWKITKYYLGSRLSIEYSHQFEFNDYFVVSTQFPKFPLVAPSSTWGQVDKHINKNLKSRSWEIIRRSSRNLKQFSVRKVQENKNSIGWKQSRNTFSFWTEVHQFQHERGSMLAQDFVFLVKERRVEELGQVFIW